MYVESKSLRLILMYCGGFVLALKVNHRKVPGDENLQDGTHRQQQVEEGSGK